MADVTQNVPIDVRAAPLPLNFAGTWQEWFRAFVPRIRGFIPDNQVVTGQYSGLFIDNTIYNAGPWWQETVGGVDPDDRTGGKWWIWDNRTGRYQNDVKKVGGRGPLVTLKRVAPVVPPNVDPGSILVSELDLSNKAGIWALISDAWVPRKQIVLVADEFGECEMDWSLGDDFFLLLKEDTTVTQSNSFNGGTKTLAVENLGTEFECDFEAAVKWPAGGAEPDTAKSTDPSALGGYAISIFTFRRINSGTYGRAQDFSPANPTGIIDTGGDPPPNYGGSGAGAPNDRGAHQRSLY